MRGGLKKINNLKTQVLNYIKNQNIKFYGSAILNSYAQIFFSKNLTFAIILFAVTFFDVVAGISGFLAVIVSIAFAKFLSFDDNSIESGNLSFNSLLVGLGLGIYYQPNISLFLIVVFSAVLTLFISVSLKGVVGKYFLPYLSIPFLIGIWSSFLASKHFDALGISERGIYTLNELYILGGHSLIKVYEWWNALSIPNSVRVYFISLGAIFFQYNVLSGILIAMGLLIYSRIAFTLTILGFFSAFLFYNIIGANLNELNYSYIGFNYILSSIAIGGFFLIPSKQSYLWVILLTPLLAILTVSLSSIFYVVGLPIYSLPFNLAVLLFLYILKFRMNQDKEPKEVFIQHYSPEKNLYAYQNDALRFNHLLTPVKLPFFGQWKVMQGHDGEYTHKGEWKHAWDFIIVDNDNNQFNSQGDYPEDYFCYNKAVLAPADGTIEEIIDNIDDNIIGQVNLNQNWGNTVIIKHSDSLYSSLNHLKKESIKVKKGDSVKTGQILASVGNSGRSAYPHLHFQLQETPFIGSKTLEYPLSNYVSFEGNDTELHSYQKPKKEQIIANTEKTTMIEKAFQFIPGEEIVFEITEEEHKYKETWRVDTNEYNTPFIENTGNKAIAWFKYDGDLFYFTHYEGKKSGFLYYFFIGAYKILTGFYKNITFKDKIATNILFSGITLKLHDFVSPFSSYIKTDYSITYKNIDNDFSPSKIELTSEVTNSIFNKVKDQYHFDFEINSKGFLNIQMSSEKKNLVAECIEK